MGCSFLIARDSKSEEIESSLVIESQNLQAQSLISDSIFKVRVSDL